MSTAGIESLKIKAKLLQKIKKNAGKPIQLKDAFDILAKASGFKSWRELKELFEATEHYCPKGSSARWKVWYKSYDQAEAQLKAGDGFLLPYRDHFFICDFDYVHFLGIERDDTDLKNVGRNWVEPNDAEAFFRLNQKIRRNTAG